MKNPLNQIKGITLLGAIYFFAIVGQPAHAEEVWTVKWTRSIYAPSFGLDDDRVVTRQAEFGELYAKWSRPVQFPLVLNKTSTLAVFENCSDIIKFYQANNAIRGDTTLDGLRFATQVSNCAAWSMMGKLNYSHISHLPNLIDGTDKPKSILEAVEFTKMVIRKIIQSRKSFKNIFLQDFELSDGWEINCDSSNECRYEVPDDYTETYMFSLLGQGDYNGDGINDYFISVFSPKKKTGYLGLIVTRKKRNGEIEIIGEY